MVMTFSVERVFNYLRDNGVVYTVRVKRKKTGKDWCNTKRGRSKAFDIKVKHVRKLAESEAELKKQLEPYVGESGFGSV